MDLQVGSTDHRDNEFYSYRYSTRFQKGDIVEVRTGIDLEAARFQARKSFPDVLNEYWWLKPSDVPALKNLPLKITDIYFYHGGVPVLVMLTANGSLARKAQVFLKKRDEPKSNVNPDTKDLIGKLNVNDLCELLHDQDLLIRLEVIKNLESRFPDFIPDDPEEQAIFHILKSNYSEIAPLGQDALEVLIERFFVTSNAKETERIIDTLIEIGQPALERLDDMSEFLSLMASPYYAKRINWTVSQINKKTSKKRTV